MNTTDYFTYVNAMFLFCIFICLLLLAVGWQLSRKSEKLKKEQDSHLKATKINSLLTKENKEIDDKLAQAEHKLRDAEKEIRELQAKLDHAEADRIELRAERATLENKLTDALAKVRKRDKDGKFLPSGNGRVKRVKKVSLKVSADITAVEDAVDSVYNVLTKIKAESPKLIHGLTVKNPTEDEAKMIFDEARRLKIKVSKNDLGVPCPNIWVYHKKICVCVEGVADYEWVTVVTANEFVQRMKNGRG